MYPSPHVCVQWRLFGKDIIVGIVLRAKRRLAYLKRFTTWRATPDDICTSAQSVTVYVRLILCINTFCDGLNGAEQPKLLLCQGLSCTTTSFSRRWLQSSQQPSTVYSNSFTRKCARCAHCSAATSQRFAQAAVGHKLWRLCSNSTTHIAIIQSLRFRITQVVYALAKLDTFCPEGTS